MSGTRPTGRLLPLLLILLTLGLASGCARRDSEPFRIGINPWPGYEFIYLAEHMGYYKAQGLDVRVVQFSSLADARRAYERGQLDAIATTVVEVLQIRDQSARSPQVVRVMDYSEGADVILVRDSTRTGAALRGARIGVELASLGVYVLARGLEHHALTLNDITPVSMDQLSMEEAFNQGMLDAVVTYPPTSVKLLAEGHAHTIYSTAEIPGEVLDVIAVEAEVNRTRADVVRRFMTALDMAIDHTAQSPVESYAIMAAREGITPGQFTTALHEGIQLVGSSEQSAYFTSPEKLKAVIQRTDRVLRSTGQLANPPRDADILNPAFLNAGHRP